VWTSTVSLRPAVRTAGSEQRDGYDGPMPDARSLVHVAADPVSVDEALRAVADPAAGGTCVFVGTVRDHSAGGTPVTELTYEAWDELARERLGEIAAAMHERWKICRVALLHATGALAIGEPSVVVAVSAPHRAEAFEAARYGIEELKRDVPIWKKEAFATGEADWVMGA
jgi:molybdopterin synthase catalytic subunit